MRDAERLADEMRRENPGMQRPERQRGLVAQLLGAGHRSVQAGFRALGIAKQNLLVALEDVESKVSDELRARENKERLNAGGHDAVSDAYRELVDKYYRSLAAPRTEVRRPS